MAAAGLPSASRGRGRLRRRIPDRSGEIPVVDAGWSATSASTLALSAFPNPAGSGTVFDYSIPAASGEGHAEITVHDVAGRVVRVLSGAPGGSGRHAVPWDGLDASGHSVPAGVYLCRVRHAAGSATGKVTILR